MKNDSNSPIPPPKQKKTSIVAAQKIQEFRGPIPSPETFQQYAQVIPDAPERILKVFEQDSQTYQRYAKGCTIC